MAHEKKFKMACSKVVGQKEATSVEEVVEEVETLSDTEEDWFAFVNQKLEKTSVMRRIRDQERSHELPGGK
jgi:hypothetical protein